jgi:tetratricopeptide (TPR) repeat protein
MFYKGTKKSLSEIARELGVEAVVEGSVLREGDRVGITAQLIEAATGENLWADRYERDLTSILALQGEIAQTIASQIQVALTPAEENLLTRTREVNPEAYEAYLKGLSHFYKIHPSELEKARLYFEEALEKDPEFALAYVGIAFAWIGFRQMGAVPPEEAGLKVKAAIKKAFELDDSLPEVHYVDALDKTWGDWDWKGAETAFLRAIEMKPNYPDALVYYSHLLCYLGRVEEAVELAERATQLDPFNPLFQSISACTLFFAGRIEETIARSQNALKSSPKDPVALSNLWETNNYLGKYEEAGKYAKVMLEVFGPPLILDIYDQGFAEAGHKGAMKRVADLMAEFSRETFVEPYWIAELYLFVGDRKQALDWLEKGYEMRSPMMPYIIWQIFDPLWDEPRYQELLRKMDFPESVINRQGNER